MQVSPPVTPWGAPQEFVDADNEFRLIRDLRGRANFREPTLILAHSATEFFSAQRAQSPDERRRATDLGTAIADLAATGRQAYARFKGGINMVKLEGLIRERLDAQSLAVRPSDAEIKSATDQALDRAYKVAWALRGPVAQRAELRLGLGWIAVSPEDDTPHRPVNVSAPPFEQYEVQVKARGAGEEIALWTRFFVASVDDVPRDATPFAARRAPDDPVPLIPGDHRVLLFLHGHSSGAEEALDLIPHLLQERPQARKEVRRHLVRPTEQRLLRDVRSQTRRGARGRRTSRRSRGATPRSPPRSSTSSRTSSLPSSTR